MIKRRKYRKLLAVCSFVLLFGASGRGMAAAGSTDSYNYSYWGDTVAAPAAYEPTMHVNGEQTGAGPFKGPGDLYVSADQHIYVADSGNNRIVVLDSNFKLTRTIETFLDNGQRDTFSNPQGVFVTDEGMVIIADTGNQRVVQLDPQDRLIRLISDPESDLLTANFRFLPTRAVMDKAQRLYVMSSGVFDGFMEFNANGEFTSFIGANRVVVDPVEYVWKMLSTRQQRSQMVMFTPTEFTNLDINDEGFIYATNGDASGDNIKLLNAQGNDILRRNGYYSPQGDIRYTSDDGPSRLIDIDVWDSEIYSVLDAKRGRVFTYNGDGHLMYIFGGIGNRLGQFHTPAAIGRIGDSFLVVDKTLGDITVFRTTEYGRTLNEAVRSYYRGDEETAFRMFRQTIEMNANLEFAYTGLGKALLRQGNYYDAMTYLKKSMDQENYSKAFLLYRKQTLRENFSLVMTTVVLIVVGLQAFRLYRKREVRKRGVAHE